MISRPLFVPLRTEYYQAFKAGTKRTEYRLYGPRWNEKQCAIGRPVLLSHGYGTRGRLTGKVAGFEVSEVSTPDWEAVYGPRGDRLIACIHIELDSSPVSP